MHHLRDLHLRTVGAVEANRFSSAHRRSIAGGRLVRGWVASGVVSQRKPGSIAAAYLKQQPGGMGAGWRRFAEQARQKWHIAPAGALASTTNARNELMLQEAGNFAGHLKRCEKDIRNLKNATEGLLNTTKIVMSAPLPKVFEDTGNGTAQPAPVQAPGATGPIGGDFKVDELQRVAKETAKKLEAEVLAPMQRWTTAYTTVQARMNKLEGLRLEVDSRRRTVAELGQRIDRQRARLPQTRNKGEFEMEQTIKKMQHKENKLAAARQSFKEQEAMVYQQLAQLIRDAVWLKSYIAAVMRLEQEAFSSAYNSLGPQKGAVDMTSVVGALPGIPDGGAANGMPPAAIGAPRPMDGSPQGGPGMLRTMSSKVRRQPSGKENGLVGAGGSGLPVGGPKAEYVEAAPVPMQRIARAPSATSGYSRYGEQPSYGQEQWA